MGKERKNGGTGRRENGRTEVTKAQQTTHFIVHTKDTFTHCTCLTMTGLH